MSKFIFLPGIIMSLVGCAIVFVDNRVDYTNQEIVHTVSVPYVGENEPEVITEVVETVREVLPPGEWCRRMEMGDVVETPALINLREVDDLDGTYVEQVLAEYIAELWVYIDFHRDRLTDAYRKHLETCQ